MVGGVSVHHRTGPWFLGHDEAEHLSGNVGGRAAYWSPAAHPRNNHTEPILFKSLLGH